jgi:outer membrane murein-binding lipoprotein Lpp
LSIQTDTTVRYLQTRVDTLEAKVLELQKQLEALRAPQKEPLSLKRATR